eukprot:745787-Hanusia_phi.AAC.1
MQEQGEGWGQVPWEAQASGIPTIIADLPCWRDLTVKSSALRPSSSSSTTTTTTTFLFQRYFCPPSSWPPPSSWRFSLSSSSSQAYKVRLSGKEKASYGFTQESTGDFFTVDRQHAKEVERREIVRTNEVKGQIRSWDLFTNNTKQAEGKTARRLYTSIFFLFHFHLVKRSQESADIVETGNQHVRARNQQESRRVCTGELQQFLGPSPTSFQSLRSHCGISTYILDLFSDFP